MSLQSIFQVRLVTLATAAILALGIAACGGSDDDTGGTASNGGNNSDSNSSNSSSDEGNADATGDSEGSNEDSAGADGGGSEEQQAQAAVEGLYAAIAGGDAEKVCESLNSAAQKQLVENGLAKTGSCAESFQTFLDKAKKAGGLSMTLKAKVKSVQISGNTAVAKVGFGEKGREGTIPLEKVDGEWKMGAAGAAPSQ